jgi:hypothetical protein
LTAPNVQQPSGSTPAATSAATPAVLRQRSSRTQHTSFDSTQHPTTQQLYAVPQRSDAPQHVATQLSSKPPSSTRFSIQINTQQPRAVPSITATQQLRAVPNTQLPNSLVQYSSVTATQQRQQHPIPKYPAALAATQQPSSVSSIQIPSFLPGKQLAPEEHPIQARHSATTLAALLRRNHVNNALSSPPAPPSASTAVASAPSSYDNFSSARLSRFCQHAIPTFSTLCHDPSGSATSNTRFNNAPQTPARSPSSPLSNLPAPAAATNYQWHKERITSVGMYGQRLECMDGGY